MGCDIGIIAFIIPLYAVYTSPDIYHVNNPINPFEIGSGDNNKFCGYYEWSCETIDYAITQSANAVLPYQIGIISEYKIRTPLTIEINSQTINI
jgi:hypothetical protein